MPALFPSQALIRRELLSNLRRTRSFVLVGALTVICALAVLSQWPSQDMLIMAATSVSEQLVNVLGLALLAGCALFVPGIAGAAIVSEKEQGSFDLLHVTLIPPRGIVFGRLVNVLGFYLLLMLGVLPVFGVVFFLVGVGWGDLLYRVLMILLSSMSCAAAGLLCSARFQKGLVAMAASYVGMLAVFGAPVVLFLASLHYFPVIFGGLDREIGDLVTIPTRLLMRLFPEIPSDYGDAEFCLLTLCHIVSPLSAFFEESRTYMTPWRYVAGAVYQVLFTIVCAWLTVRTLRRPPTLLKVDGRKPIDDAVELEARRKRFPYYLIDPLRRSKEIEDGRNPVFVKELRWGTLGRMTVLVRVFYAVLMLDMIAATGCIVTQMSGNMTESISTSMALLIIITCAFAPALLANMFTKEREHGNLDMLRMTLLSPREIVVGKLGGGIVTMGPLLAAALMVTAMLALFVGVVWFDVGLLAIMVGGVITLLVCAGIVLSVSLSVSIRSRGTTASLVMSYSLSLGLLLGLFVLGYILWQGFVYPAQDFSDHPYLSSYYVSPWRYFTHWGDSTTALVTALSPLTVYSEATLSGVDFEAGVLWFVSMAGFALLSMVLFANGLQRFERRSMRD